MNSFFTAVTGQYEIKLPQWGRAFWQCPTEGDLFLAFASGNYEVDYITSSDSGVTWSEPQFLFPVDDFSVHNNFDICMDRRGHIHCGFRWNDSGCYRFVARSEFGGWTLSSGLGVCGWISAGDSGNARGFQGSLSIKETKHFWDSAAYPHPAVRMVGKNNAHYLRAAIVPYPHDGYPALDTDPGLFDVGEDGGYPIIFNEGPAITTAGFPRATKIAWFDHGAQWLDGMYSISTASKTTTSWVLGNDRIIDGNFFGESMAFGSGIGPSGCNGIALICDNSGQALYLNTESSTGYNRYIHVSGISHGTDVYWRNMPGSGTRGFVPTSGIYGVGPNNYSGSGITRHDFPGSGTNCDFSFNDDSELILYFQRRDEYGRQCIARITSTFDRDNWQFYPTDDASHGVKNIATASYNFTGGFSNTLFWGGFKALRHPTEPIDGGNKAELLVTQGWTCTYPSGGILTIWDVKNSPAFNRWKVPENSFDYMLTSGTANPIFVGISKFQNVTDANDFDLLPNMFDDTYSQFAGGTYGEIQNGYYLEVELDKPRPIDRVEIAQIGSYHPHPNIHISGSFDGQNFVKVVDIPSGDPSLPPYTFNGGGESLFKYQSMSQTITTAANTRASMPINFIDPFVAKYVGFQFIHPTDSPHRIYEIKLYGPGANSPEVITWSDFVAEPMPTYRTLYYVTGSTSSTATENFSSYSHGDVPTDWSTYGDFEWRVVGSGGNEDGTVPSGAWHYVQPSRGINTGFALRSEAIGDSSGLGSPLGTVSSNGIQPGDSGVAEFEINISASEGSRQVSFYFRSDMHIDDYVTFQTFNPNDIATNASGTLQRVYYRDESWSNVLGSTVEYVDPDIFTFTGEGTHRLRWIYYKGAYDVLGGFNNPFGAAWIANVSGVDVTNYYVENARHGYLYGDTGTVSTGSGSIHGYLTSPGWTQIHGVIPLVDPLSSSINGYIYGSPRGTIVNSSLNGYVLGNKQSAIHGFILSTSGNTAVTYPTGTIYGYVAVNPSGFTEKIHGYVLGAKESAIHGYLHGLDSLANALGGSGDLKINGYTISNYIDSSIHGIVNSFGLNTSITDINGFVQSRYGIGDQTIYAYVGGFPGEETFDTRKGFILGWNNGPDFFRAPQSMVYGYLYSPIDSGNDRIWGYVLANKPYASIHGYLGNEALVPSGGGTVAGGPGSSSFSTSNVEPQNWIHGYVKGDLGAQYIHGYLSGPPGGTSTIYSYVLSGEEDQAIHGYLEGCQISSGIIYGYTNVSAASTIYGYTFGISGIIDSSIHGILIGDTENGSFINGTLIGISSASNSSAVTCVSHNYPLPALPTITIPTSFY